MLQPIEEFCKKLIEDDPSITPAEMLHNLHMAGYGRETSILEVKKYFSDLTVEEMCLIIVNEYDKPLIARDELKRLLLACGYDETAVNQAVSLRYPKSLGYIMMLDDSYSMHSASDMIKIDAKAFIDCSRTEDEFGINRFEADAGWVYPSGSSPAPTVVTEGRSELEAAKAAIDGLRTEGRCTNIGAAVSLANDMVEKMTSDIKAYVLISDGEHNTGSPPASILKSEPPVYIAGLGPYMQEYYFRDMLDKNTKSKFYNSPNAADMMTVFNQILADSSQSLLSLNHLETCQGINYSIQEFSVLGRGNRTLVNVVWSDKKYRYTSGYPDKNGINLVLIDSDNRSTSIRPRIVDDGFCIFDLHNVRPGKWKLLAQYALDAPIQATAGAIQMGAPVSIEVAGVQTAGVGEKPVFAVKITGAELVSDLKIDAVYSLPAVDFRKAMTVSGKENAGPEMNFTDEDALRFPRVQEPAALTNCGKGVFQGTFTSALSAGVANAYLTVTGVYRDGTPFMVKKLHSVMVE